MNDGWFDFMENQPLLVINANSILIHTNKSIPKNSVEYKYSFCLDTVICEDISISTQKQFYFKLFSLA